MSEHGAVNFQNKQRLRAVTQAAFEQHRQFIHSLLPTARIEHIGSTAVPGARSKGDLDILALVEPREFAAANTTLGEHFERNEGVAVSNTFAIFKDDSVRPALGIQLAAQGDATLAFIAFRDLLRSDKHILTAYNALKTAYQGRPIGEYKTAKAECIGPALRGLIITAKVKPHHPPATDSGPSKPSGGKWRARRQTLSSNTVTASRTVCGPDQNPIPVKKPYKKHSDRLAFANRYQPNIMFCLSKSCPS